ncbi:serine aminopeptidase domain-containing protein [Actinomadura yumaensis]|uniref:serine aminopeptidase domain-containing protein n=1 Tax=Actinomadura yumaensis TaxID=111807 RepID=UPI0036201262
MDGPKDDQRVSLDTSFYAPVGRRTGPAVMLGHGFGGSKDDTRGEAERLARAGYAVLTWSARGFGRSGGEIALNSPTTRSRTPGSSSTGSRSVPRCGSTGPATRGSAWRASRTAARSP